MDARWMHGVTSSQTNCKNPVRNAPWRDEGQAFLDLPNSQGGSRRFSWEPAKPRPNQTTSRGPYSAAIGSTSSAEREADLTPAVPSPQKIVSSPRKFTEDPLCDVRNPRNGAAIFAVPRLNLLCSINLYSNAPAVFTEACGQWMGRRHSAQYRHFV